MLVKAKYIGKWIAGIFGKADFQDVSDDVSGELCKLKTANEVIWNAIEEMLKTQTPCNMGEWINPVIESADFNLSGWSDAINFEREFIKGDYFKPNSTGSSTFRAEVCGIYSVKASILMDISFNTPPSGYWECVMGIYKNGTHQANLARSYNAAIKRVDEEMENQFKFSLSGCFNICLECGDEIDLRIWHSPVDVVVVSTFDCDGHFGVNYLGACAAVINEPNSTWRT